VNLSEPSRSAGPPNLDSRCRSCPGKGRMLRYALLTVDGKDLGTVAVSVPDWPEGSILHRGDKPNLRVRASHAPSNGNLLSRVPSEGLLSAYTIEYRERIRRRNAARASPLWNRWPAKPRVVRPCPRDRVIHRPMTEQQLRESVPGRIRSPRASSRARTSSRAASSARSSPHRSDLAQPKPSPAAALAGPYCPVPSCVRAGPSRPCTVSTVPPSAAHTS